MCDIGKIGLIEVGEVDTKLPSFVGFFYEHDICHPLGLTGLLD